MNKFSSILWGIVLISIGVIIAINSLGLANINIFFDGWWTLFIIVPCFINLFNSKEEKTGNLIGLAIGTILLLAAQNLISFSIIAKLILPFILICIGLSIIFKDTINKEAVKKIKELNKSEIKEYSATFSGQNIDYSNEKFDGVSLSSIFGGIKCDISNAIIEKDAVINTTAVFGGIDIIVPQNVNVKIKSNSIFGGVDKKKMPLEKEGQKTIYINAFCLFGGVDIK